MAKACGKPPNIPINPRKSEVFLVENSVEMWKTTHFHSESITVYQKGYLVSVDLEYLDRVVTNNKIKIKERNFAYTIKSISETLSLLNKPVEVFLNIKLDDNMNIINNVIQFKIIEKEMTILEYIREKVGIF